MRGLLGSGYDPSIITIYSAPLFLLLFACIFWLVYRREDKPRYETYSQLPLEKDVSLGHEGVRHEEKR